MQSYLGYVNEMVVKEQFMTVYHLVDEVSFSSFSSSSIQKS